MANTYDVGDVIRITAAFTQTSVAVDPTVVTVRVLTPAGVATTYTYGTDVELVKDSTGNYHFDLTLAAAGKYSWRWTSTGTGAAAEESFLIVRHRRVA